ncbi:MAG: TonB-dependent receptor [Chitinophagales bacterium]
MKFRTLLMLVLTGFSLSLYSQDAKLVGTVTEESGTGLISANVVIDPGKGWAAVTDFDGNYEIKLPAGTYEVAYRYVGKEEKKVTVTLAAGQTVKQDVVLTEKQQILDVAVVTGTKYAKPLGEQTVSVDVVKGTSLTSGGIVSLDQGMTRIPGVTIADGQVNIRGGAGWSYGAGSRVSVLIDDLPLLTADAADAKWSIVPMENVDQIEVIKGASSALYGSSALNGIVNVRTAYPTNEPYAKVTVYAGVYGPPTKTPGMKWWGTNSPLAGGVNFAWRQKFGQNDLVVGGAFDGTNGYLDSSDGHAIRGTVKYRYRVKKVPGLNFGVNLSAYHSWGKTFFFWNGLDTLGYKPFANTITQYKTYRVTVDPFIDYYDSKENHIKFLGRFFNATNTNNTGQGSVSNRYYTELQYLKKYNFKKFDFNFVTGVVNVFDDVNPPKSASGSLFGKNSSYNFSVYAQTDFKFFGRLNVSLGARWEYFQMKHYEKDSTASINGTDTTYSYNQKLISTQNSLKELTYPLFRIGLNYQAAKATYIRASFGQGFRYPTIAERYITTRVGPLTIGSNPNLKPEKGYSAEVGVKQGFAMGKGWMGFADAAFFWNQYDNMMEFTFGQFGDTLEWDKLYGDYKGGLGFSSQNVGKTRILGTEFTIGGQGDIGPVQLQFLVGYTFIDPRSLNWNNEIRMYNYQGVQLQPTTNLDVYPMFPGYEVKNQPIYNEANKTPADSGIITYAMTSSSKSNVLKYRNRHTFKADVTLTWKGLEWNTNLQYNSYMENIDYAFIGTFFKTLGTTAFGGLEQYRKAKEATPIGKGRGDIVWNMHLAYNFKAGVRVAFIVRNLLNWEYTPRPAYFEAPRNYMIQLSYVMPQLGKKQGKDYSNMLMGQ